MGEAKDLFKKLPLDRSRRSLRLFKLVDYLKPDVKGYFDFPDDVALEVFNESTAPPYIALSYMWGDGEYRIRVNSCRISITPNLSAFLAAVVKNAEDYQALWFWADQISMNQADIQERNHQVSHMGRIYSNASKVWAWLDAVLEVPKQYAERAMASPYADDTGSLRLCLLILNHQYWTRLWIVQELCLAKDITFWYGDAQFTRQNLLTKWDSVRRFRARQDIMPRESPWSLKSLRSKGSQSTMRPPLTATEEEIDFLSELLDSSHMAATITELLQFQQYRKPPTLVEAINRFGRGECSNTRDKVYGLIALVQERERVLVQYNRTLKEVILDGMKNPIMATLTNAVDMSIAEPNPVLTKLCENLCEIVGCDESCLLEFEIMAWAGRLSFMPGWASVRSLSDAADCFEEWQRLWQNMAETSISIEQRRLANNMISLAYDWEVKVEEIRTMQVQKAGTDSVSPAQDRKDLATDSARSMLMDAAQRQGFVEIGTFLCHPDDWPIKDEIPNPEQDDTNRP